MPSDANGHRAEVRSHRRPAKAGAVFGLSRSGDSMMPAAPAFAGATMALAAQKFEGGRSGGPAALFTSGLDNTDAPVGLNRHQPIGRAQLTERGCQSVQSQVVAVSSK